MTSNQSVLFRDIFNQHQGKASHKWESYLPHYDRLLSNWKDKAINLLEIGVQNGGSLEVHAKYFKKAKCIVGCDINPDVGSLQYTDPRIHIIIDDAASPSILSSFNQKMLPLDIVIDDGSHINSDIIKTFCLFFPRLTEDGLYIIEDTHTCYYPEYGGGLRQPGTAMAFFKKLCDVINQEHWDIKHSSHDELMPFLEENHLVVSTKIFDWLDTIYSIEFANSLIIIKKAKKEESLLGRRRVVGDEEAITPLPKKKVKWYRRLLTKTNKQT